MTLKIENLVLRPIKSQDAEDAWYWKNDRVTRNNSGHTGIVEWKGHNDWWCKVAGEASNFEEGQLVPGFRRLRVAEIDGVAVGLVRTDGADGPTVNVHYTVAPEYRRQGFGKAMVTMFVEIYSIDVVKMILPIKQGNVGSEKIAASLGLMMAAGTEDFVEKGQPPIVNWVYPDAGDA